MLHCVNRALLSVQVGSSAAEWSAVVAAVQRLAEPQQAASTAGAVVGCSTTAAAGNSSTPPPYPDRDKAAGAAAAGSTGDAAASASSSGCQVAAELLAELQHLPCFLLMEFVEGSKLSDCPQAVDQVSALVHSQCAGLLAHDRVLL